MNKKRHAFQNWPIALKLNTLLLPALLAVLFIFAFLCNSFSLKYTSAQITAQLQLQTESAANAIDSMVNEVSRLSMVAYTNEQVRAGLKDALLSPQSFDASRRIQYYRDTLAPVFSIMDSPNKYTVRLYPLSDQIFCDYEYTLPLSLLPAPLDLDTLTSKGFAGTLHTVYQAEKSTAIFPRSSYRALLIAQVIYASRFSDTPLGVLTTEINTSYLETTVVPYTEKENGSWYQLTLENGDILFEKGLKAPSSITVSVPLASFPGRLEIGFPSTILERQIKTQSTLFLSCALLLMPLCFLLITRLSRLALRRFSGVIRKYRQLSADKETLAPPLEGMDEAAQLDQSFSKLYQNYRSSLKNTYELKIRHRQLETNLLLSKINPHFLYNTLSAIKWSLPADEGDVIDRLIALYRGMLGQGKDAAPLENELETLEQYVALQRYTYSRDICYTVEAEESIRRVILPKFLLQPVIENAILHGTAENQPCRIRLQAEANKDQLVIRIENDGPSMNTQVLQNLNQLNDMPTLALTDYIMEPNDRHSYGIFNIITRIRLLFGKGFGLWHEIPEKGGTAACFILPLSWTAEEYRAKTKIE